MTTSPSIIRGSVVLDAVLQAAVPMWIELIRAERWAWGDIAREASACATVLASEGDVLMFVSPKRGETTSAFNALARGLACAAFAPGGIDAFGAHYEARKDWSDQ